VPAPLRIGQKLHSDDGRVYQVTARIGGNGGYGDVYDAYRLSADDKRLKRVCVKVCRNRHDWHGEAFFGELLRDEPGVVRLHDAFVAATGVAHRQRRRHVLVFDFMPDGTVFERLESGRMGWSEARIRAQTRKLLEVLARLHRFGITHRDLKPANVFVANEELLLGDFGLAQLALSDEGSAVTAWTREFSPHSIVQDRRPDWGPADDVFQVGLLACTLLRRAEVWGADVGVDLLAGLPAADWFKTWIWHATGARQHRYANAAEALAALRELRSIDLAPGRAPRSLEGQHVVFTGRLDGVSRQTAVRLARDAGAQPQTRVNGSTSVLVRGAVDAGSTGAREGLKLHLARESLRRGQAIRIIGQRQFERLTSA
jgi:serine/threonine protein kinase